MRQQNIMTLTKNVQVILRTLFFIKSMEGFSNIWIIFIGILQDWPGQQIYLFFVFVLFEDSDSVAIFKKIGICNKSWGTKLLFKFLLSKSLILKSSKQCDHLLEHLGAIIICNFGKNKVERGEIFTWPSFVPAAHHSAHAESHAFVLIHHVSK